MASSPTTALVLGALGDFLLTLPLLVALRARGPVAVITRRSYRALLPGVLADAPFLDLDSAAVAGLFTPSTTDLDAALRACLSGAQVQAFMRPDPVVAAGLARAAAHGVVWHDTRPRTPPHLVRRFFATAGLPPPSDCLERPLLADAPPTGRGLWLHPGSGSPAKSLPPATAAALVAARLAPGQPLHVSFGEADLDLVEPVRQALAARGLEADLVLCPTLAELRRRLAVDAAAYIGPDTGVSHLAAAVGLPVTVVFRATDPAIWRPVGRVSLLEFEALPPAVAGDSPYAAQGGPSPG